MLVVVEAVCRAHHLLLEREAQVAVVMVVILGLGRQERRIQVAVRVAPYIAPMAMQAAQASS